MGGCQNFCMAPNIMTIILTTTQMEKNMEHDKETGIIMGKP